jgi:hypothetical protein
MRARRQAGLRAVEVHYSWRHDFISQLAAAKVDPSLRRYLEGPGAKGVDERFYIDHKMRELVGDRLN